MDNKHTSGVNRQAFYNISSSAILSGINFLTIPIFTRLLGATQFGLFSVFHSWTAILMCVMGIQAGAGNGTARYVFPAEYKRYQSSALLLGTLTSGVFLTVGVIFRDVLSSLTGYPPGIVSMMFLCSLAQYVVGFSNSVFIYAKRARFNFIVSVSLSLSTVLLSLFLASFFTPDRLYLSRVYGFSIPYLLAAGLLWPYLFLCAPAGIRKPYVQYCLTMGIPVVFHILAHDVLKQSDRLMMGGMGYAGAPVGVYSFFCTYTNILTVILNALNTSWTPFYYDDLHEKAFDRLAGKCRNYLELFTVLACGFLLLAREVCYLFAGEEYWGGMNVIPLLVTGIYFTFLYQFPVNFEFFHRKTKIIAAGTSAAAGINILLNAVLIPPWGMYGAALATTISYALLFAAHFIIVHFIREMRFHMTLWVFLPGLAAVLILSALFEPLADFVVLRWLTGAVLGVTEIYRIIRRKSIF